MLTSSESPGKPFDISRREVWQAWLKVRGNGGAPGVDGVSVEDFESDLENQLYKVWNRMSSGSYFPPPVRGVNIPKPHGGGMRTLGIPTVADRVAQTVVAARMQERVEKVFHPDSYGYRPGKSALDAVAAARARCWKRDWVIDLDIKAFFDTVPWELVIKAVTPHLDVDERGKGPEGWMLMCIRRWLAAPLVGVGQGVQVRQRGTPQGSAISPVLANLFMHYAFDMWVAREHPTVVFERYADDVAVHCATQRQAGQVLADIVARMEQVGLIVHPEKTKIVYCKDSRRSGVFAVVTFTFLGFTFAPRAARDRRGRVFTSFAPAISRAAVKKIGTQIRRWRLHRRIGSTLPELARWINPVVAGWMNYYGRFHRSQMYRLLGRINAYLVRWLRSKYRRLRRGRRAYEALTQTVTAYPRGFRHWEWVATAW